MKRFWNAVSFEAVESGFQIKLDNRTVRTPAKKPMVVPSETIARKVAAEWEAQVEKVDPSSMPWTRTSNAAVDKVSLQRADVMAHIGGYAGTDLLCYRAEGPESLVHRQTDVWDPILLWVEEHYGVALQITSGVMPIDQDHSDIARLASEMDPMTNFQLTGFHDLVGLSGSFCIGLAVAEKAFPTEALWSASSLDETWQIEQWGVDEEARIHTEMKKKAFLHAAEVYHAA